ncbi:chaperone required for assembly of F1-ATPase [Pseudorhizobium tarimense]|uniref:Chaperone required for assembly of F1-ATPase n=1 Tax=Pseudorhizobium tarimense TaxID=1079109 RepID=A0ABV2HA59_9HYPH|nr:ATP12 family chaperone protein [Pseudorhizobium tarimense]MCJ8520602.1 ATP12 family chaperone protein [Pseudorhizobium tarimense]
MSDLFDAPEGMSHPDPTRRAQIQMKRPLPKRFYEDVSIADGEGGGYVIALDGRPVRTPAKNPLSAPTAALAELMRAEWAAQGEFINPATMPVTKLVNTAIDGVAADPQAVFEDILRFSSSDLLCYRADAPDALVVRQSERWDPLIDWAANDLGARFILIEGIMPRDQPREAISAFAVTLRKYATPIELACLHTVTSLTWSAILALAFAEGRISADEAWSLAHLDEDWTEEHWGVDAEAQLRRTRRHEELAASAAAFHSLRS